MTTAESLADAYGSLTAADVAALDAAAVRAGVPVDVLMDTAGFQVARLAHRVAIADGATRILVIAGSGNNGGDGLVASRSLRAWGWRVDVHVVADAARWPLADLSEIPALLGVGVTVDASGGSAVEALSRATRGAGVLVVDALLGTGLNAAPRPVQARVITAMRGARVLAVDVPSGLDATTGVPRDPVVHATWTCTLAAMKRGLWTAPGVVRGEVHVADIAIPAAAWASAGLTRPTLVTAGELLPVPTDT